MNYNLNDIPSEALWVSAMQWSGMPVGLSTYEKIQTIINKYPEYFEWEHKYKAIPGEVHEAFIRECYPDRFNHKDWFPANVPEGKGIVNQLMECKPYESPKDFTTVLDYFKQEIEERRLAEIKALNEKKRVEKIWDKHYKDYNLECRENTGLQYFGRYGH